jgi:hypothetical protein
MGAFDIQGKNCVFQLKIDDTYKTVVCAKSFTFNPITDMKETTTVGSGFWKEFRPRKLSYTITFNGMFQVKSSNTQEKIKTMFDYQIGFLPVPYRLIYTDNSGNIMGVDGWVYVTSTLLDASPVNLVNGTVELQGNGPIETFDTIPQPINIHITSSGESAIAALIQFKLYNSVGDIVFDSGQLPEASGGDLAHPVDVTGQVQAGSYYFFWQVTTDGIGNQFQLDAPPTKSTSFNNGISNENTFGVQTYDFTANRSVVFTFGINNPPPTCVSPSIANSNVPDGQEAVYWSGSVELSGSQPFTLSNITKPSWMNIGLSGSTVTLYGALPTSGNNQAISFDITNACGSVSFSDTLNISSNPNVVNVNWNFSNTATNPNSTFIVFKNGVQVLSQGPSGSGTLLANPGDVFEARIIGPSFSVHKEIHALTNTSFEVASAGPATTTSVSTSPWTVNMLAQPYQINATATN